MKNRRNSGEKPSGTAKCTQLSQILHRRGEVTPTIQTALLLLIVPAQERMLSTSSLSTGQQKVLDIGTGCCQYEKLISEIQTIKAEMETLKTEIQTSISNIIEEKIKSLTRPIPPAYYKINGLSPTSTEERVRIPDFEPNFIDANNLEDEPLEVEKNLWCDPKAAHELIIQFLFDENLDSSSMVVNFGREHLSRYDIKSLGPENLVIDSVINCVAYVASMNHKADNPQRSSLFFPSRFADFIFQDKYGDAELVDWFLMEDDEEFKVEKVEKLYIPINDTHRHWYLTIIDLCARTIMICDTRPTPMMMDFRKNQVTKLANKLGQLIGKGKIGNTFSYEYPKWVPFQTNVYDCGLYVCLILLLSEEKNKKLEKAESVKIRHKLAIYLYTYPHNKVAWEGH